MAFGSGMTMFRNGQRVQIMGVDYEKYRGKIGDVVYISDDGSATIRLDCGSVVREVWPEDCEPVAE